MAAIHEIAYPRLKSTFSQQELNEYYTPSREELSLCKSSTRKEASQIVFLALLKTFQRLGYFVMITEVALPIINHITNYLGVLFVPKEFLKNYDGSGSRARHMKWIRYFSQTKLFDEKSRHSITEIAYQTAKTKEYLADIINVLLEYSIKEHYELPAFIK